MALSKEKEVARLVGPEVAAVDGKVLELSWGSGIGYWRGVIYLDLSKNPESAEDIAEALKILGSGLSDK
jgi:hypothetical protein